jgi:thymidylate kinase
LVLQFQKAGFKVLDEAFMDMPEYALHPQTLVMETVWLSNWFMRLLEMSHTVQDSSHQIFIADRSPYSSEFYASHGHLLGPVIKEQLLELKSKNIHVFTVLIHTEKELLWSRINERLRQEPHRVKYNEHSREWMEKTYDWYVQHEWDFTVDNGDWTIASTQGLLMDSLLVHAKEHDTMCWEEHGLFLHQLDKPICA